jgi:hypothetical protein
VRAIVGALGGALLGMILVFVVAGGIAASIGNEGGGAIGLVMVMWGVPVALVVGAILGGRGAAGGRSSRTFRSTAIAATVLVVFAIGLRVMLPDNRPKPAVDAQGCLISERYGTSGSGQNEPRYVVVYDRYCRGEDGHTVNVSVTTLSDTLRGPGNALVLAGDEKLEGPNRHYQVSAVVRDSLHVEVTYDDRAPVLSQASRVRGYEVAFRPDVGMRSLARP